MPAHKITLADIQEVFDEYDELGRSGRTINKVREQLRAIFNYGCDARYEWRLESNPAALTEPSKVNQRADLKCFEIEQVEAIAAAAHAGSGEPKRRLPTSAVSSPSSRSRRRTSSLPS